MQQGVVGKGNEAREQSFAPVCNFLKDESRSHQNVTGCSVCSWLRGSVSGSLIQVVWNSLIQLKVWGGGSVLFPFKK